MLVLNRRGGESIVIDHGIEVMVLSVSDRKVWLGIEAPDLSVPVRLSAVALSDKAVRIEIGAPRRVAVDDEIRIEVASSTHPSFASHGVVGFTRLIGQSITVTPCIGDGDAGSATSSDVKIGVASLAKGNPSLSIEGPRIGTGVRVTVVRQTGSYVRIGVEAPGRRVYRKELWEEVVSANRVAAAAEDLSSLREVGSRGRAVV